MLSEFERKIADFIEANGCLSGASRVLLAVSGGADSMALLSVMSALKRDGVFDGELVCGHVNHQLRGLEADRDEDFVKSEAAKLGVRVVTGCVDVEGFARSSKLSIETAARELRRESLTDMAKANNCGYVATGHHKNDNAETVIQRLGRGTGFRGLCGIWAVREFGDGISFVRPLLNVTRVEIVEYLKKQGLQWRVDHTNSQCQYRRNFIRHRLMPELQRECGGDIVEELFELSRAARGFYGLVCERAESIWERVANCAAEKVVLDLKEFSAQVRPVKVEVVRRSLAWLGCGERDLTQGHYERILEAAEQNVSGRKIELPGGFVVWREYGKLVFAQGQGIVRKEQNSGSIEMEIPGITRFGDYLIEAAVYQVQLGSEGRYKAGKTGYVEWFDMDKLELPLQVRGRREGDKFVPLGQAEEKKVGKFLTAARVPQRIREGVLIVADREKVVWIWPIRICEQAKVSPETKRILRLQITDASERWD